MPFFKHFFYGLIFLAQNCAHSSQKWHELYSKELETRELFLEIVEEIDCLKPIELNCCKTQDSECQVCEQREKELTKIFEIKCRASESLDCQKDASTFFCCAAETFECMSCNFDALRRAGDYSKACPAAAQF
ncbi:MAG: hypothetical protein KBD78_17205 [Oligoflexales bacterium]|nr:hypothetical protein [Oligoflexales bacterium]